MKKQMISFVASSLLFAGICMVVSKPVMAEEGSDEEIQEVLSETQDTTEQEPVLEEIVEPTAEDEIAVEEAVDPYDIAYSTYSDKNGWQESADGITSGEVKTKTPIEGITIELGNSIQYAGGVEYRTGSLNVEWSDDITQEGSVAGDVENNNYLEVLQIRLFGEVANYYDVYYRVYVQNTGWLGWAKNWELAGTHGKNLYLQALQVQMIEKEVKTKPTSRSKPYIATDGFTANNLVEYEVYSNQKGWQAIKYDGYQEGVYGYRFESISIDKSSALSDVDGDIIYKTYVTGSGWQEDYSKNGEASGTIGSRIEMIQVGLTGELEEQYDVYYRIYIAGQGWLSWASNLEEAGTVGFANRLEKIQVQLVKKGNKAPGYTTNPVLMNKVTYAKNAIKDIVAGKYANHYEDPYASQFTKIKTTLTTAVQVNKLKKGEIDSLVTELKDVTSKLTYKQGSVATVYISTDSGRGNSITKATGYITTTLAVLDENGKLIEETGSVKIRGNSTAGAAKKAYTIKFESKQNVLGMGKAKKWALLANAYDPTGLRNSLVFDMAQELGLEYSSEHEIVEVYVDGKFKGMYLLTEPVEEGKTRVNIDLDNGDFLIERERSRTESDGQYIVLNGGLRFNIKEPEAMTSAQKSAVKTTMNNIVNIMNSGDYEKVCEVVDVDSFAKFYILNEYVKTMDIDFSSVFFYYKNGKLYAGPVWDYDLSMGNNGNWYGLNTTSANGWTAKLCGLFKYMCKYDEFMSLASDIFQEHDEYFASLAADGGIVDTYVKTYQTVIDRNQTKAGWACNRRYGVYTGAIAATYQGNINILKKWLNTRYTWMSNHFGTEAGLINYKSYNKTDKWLASVSDGASSGCSIGQSIKMDAFSVNLDDSLNGSILYKSCLTVSGWESDWKKDGEVSGAVNTTKKIEAVQLQLSEELREEYILTYSVKITGLGWTDWVSEGEVAGRAKSGRSIEAIRINITKK